MSRDTQAKPQQTEREFQAAVIELAETLGWKVAHFSDSRRQVRPGVFVGDKQAAGFPDLVLVKHHRLLFVELKVGKNKPTKKQEEWLHVLKRFAATTACVGVYVWRPEQMQAITALLQHRPSVSVEEMFG